MAIKHDTTLEQVPTGPKGNPEGIATCPSPNRDEVNQRGGGKDESEGVGWRSTLGGITKWSPPLPPGIERIQKSMLKRRDGNNHTVQSL